MKKLIFKFAALTILVVVLQFFIVWKFPPGPSFVPRIMKSLKQEGDILFIGASDIYWTYPKNLGKYSIPKYLDEHLPNNKVVSLAVNSGKMDIFAAITQYIVKKDYHPKIVIISINLRSFSPEWFWDPHAKFAKENFYFQNAGILTDLIYKPFAIYKNVKTPLTLEEYSKIKIIINNMYLGTIEDVRNTDYFTFSENKLKIKIAARYMPIISRNHPLLRDMAQIINDCKKGNIMPVFYITPIDYETGEEYFGSFFRESVDKNITTIQSVLAENGLQALDYSTQFGKAMFTWRDDPEFNYINEHLTEDGKKLIAKHLYESVLNQL